MFISGYYSSVLFLIVCDMIASGYIAYPKQFKSDVLICLQNFLKPLASMYTNCSKAVVYHSSSNSLKILRLMLSEKFMRKTTSYQVLHVVLMWTMTTAK